MARHENKLSARTVAALARSGRYSDGGGLYLKTDGKRRRWLFRYVFNGRVKEMGLGPASTVSLAAARKARNKWRAVFNDGGDPLEARKEENRAQKGKRTFGEIAGALIAAKESEWRNAKHRAQWRMT